MIDWAKESVTYQAILEEGKAKGMARGMMAQAKRMLLIIGRKPLGEPGLEVVAAIEDLTDLGLLEYLVLRTYDVSNWDELLSPPTGNRRQVRDPLDSEEMVRSSSNPNH